MARFIPKQFAENSTTSVVFGSFQEQGGNVGDGTISNDPATLQGGTAWPLGWKAATDNFFQIPRGEEMDGVNRVITAAIVQQFTDGITFWQPEMPVIQYQTIVQYQTGTDFPRLYINITGTSTETAPDTDTTNWFMFLNTEISYADTDASNFTATGKSVLSGFGMPSSRYMDLTLGASGATYTAPANGYFTIHGAFDTTPSQSNYTYVAMSCGRLINKSSGTTITSTGTFIPAKRGQSMYLEYSNFKLTGHSFAFFRFVYAEGEE